MLARIEPLNPQLNAFTDVTADIARRRPRSRGCRAGTALPLSGVPVTIKDITFIKGCAAGAGRRSTRTTRRLRFAVRQRVLDAGAVLLGQTTTPELGWKGETTSPVSGTTRNPWNLERTPGGSSGGAGACIAAGIGTMAHGTDGAGSIRIPACFTGIFGMKPSIGLVPVFPRAGSPISRIMVR